MQLRQPYLWVKVTINFLQCMLHTVLLVNLGAILIWWISRWISLLQSHILQNVVYVNRTGSIMTRFLLYEHKVFKSNTTNEALINLVWHY